MSGCNMHWIDVNDSLPTESDGTVLVCMPNKSPYNIKEPYVNAKHDRRVITAWHTDDDIWYYSGGVGLGGVGRDKPTHWMPLPKPVEEL